MNHIILEGFVTSGKSAVSKAIAKKNGYPVVDVAKEVSKRLNMTGNEVSDRFGDVYFHAMETFILDELAGKKKQKPSVLIISSAVPAFPQNQKYLKDLGHVYYLKVKKGTVVERLGEREKYKWITAAEEDLTERVAHLLKEREPGYKKCADYVIEADKKTPEEIADEILALEAEA